ncbi:MAG TPA: hypothetical protein V6C72_04390, partial [Chroococcales cyanobacterium]
MIRRNGQLPTMVLFVAASSIMAFSLCAKSARAEKPVPGVEKIVPSITGGAKISPASKKSDKTANSTGKTEKGWVLKQRSHVVGDTTVYLTPTAIKIERDGMALRMLCKAPNWNVEMYNELSKTCY